jgi:thiamine biosynthesis lipoprotein
MIAPPSRPQGGAQGTDLTFRAMGTAVHVRAAEAVAAATEFGRLEAILTRFAESPVTRLNRDGYLSDPPPELLGALGWAVAACELTDGLVTPLIGRSLEWHGYRQTWREGAPWRAPHGEPPAVPPISGLTSSEREIVLPPGAAIDLGGTAKTWAVERVAALLDARYAGVQRAAAQQQAAAQQRVTGEQRATGAEMPDLVIDAGGDVLVRSAAKTELDLLGAAEEWHIDLPPGTWGVATSSLTVRAWHGAHHLIDPRTRRPARGRWTQATVVARTLRHAELATKLLLFGASVPDSLGVEQAWLIDRDGSVRGTRRESVLA